VLGRLKRGGEGKKRRWKMCLCAFGDRPCEEGKGGGGLKEKAIHFVDGGKKEAAVVSFVLVIGNERREGKKNSDDWPWIRGLGGGVDSPVCSRWALRSGGKTGRLHILASQCGIAAKGGKKKKTAIFFFFSVEKKGSVSFPNPLDLVLREEKKKGDFCWLIPGPGHPEGSDGSVFTIKQEKRGKGNMQGVQTRRKRRREKKGGFFRAQIRRGEKKKKKGWLSTLLSTACWIKGKKKGGR